ncbi:hypothetical protein GNI_062690, partial [Gregarina niphandrodes]
VTVRQLLTRRLGLRFGFWRAAAACARERGRELRAAEPGRAERVSDVLRRRCFGAWRRLGRGRCRLRLVRQACALAALQRWKRVWYHALSVTFLRERLCVGRTRRQLQLWRAFADALATRECRTAAAARRLDAALRAALCRTLWRPALAQLRRRADLWLELRTHTKLRLCARALPLWHARACRSRGARALVQKLARLREAALLRLALGRLRQRCLLRRFTALARALARPAVRPAFLKQQTFNHWHDLYIARYQELPKLEKGSGRGTEPVARTEPGALRMLQERFEQRCSVYPRVLALRVWRVCTRGVVAAGCIASGRSVAAGARYLAIWRAATQHCVCARRIAAQRRREVGVWAFRSWRVLVTTLFERARAFDVVRGVNIRARAKEALLRWALAAQLERYEQRAAAVVRETLRATVVREALRTWRAGCVVRRWAAQVELLTARWQQTIARAHVCAALGDWRRLAQRRLTAKASRVQQTHLRRLARRLFRRWLQCALRPCLKHPCLSLQPPLVGRTAPALLDQRGGNGLGGSGRRQDTCSITDDCSPGEEMARVDFLGARPRSRIRAPSADYLQRKAGWAPTELDRTAVGEENQGPRRSAHRAAGGTDCDASSEPDEVPSDPRIGAAQLQAAGRFRSRFRSIDWLPDGHRGLLDGSGRMEVAREARSVKRPIAAVRLPPQGPSDARYGSNTVGGPSTAAAQVRPAARDGSRSTARPRNRASTGAWRIGIPAE